MGFFSRWTKPPPPPTSDSPDAAPESDADLEHAMELAGFFAAHAVWSVSDGETLVPIGGVETPANANSTALLPSVLRRA